MARASGSTASTAGPAYVEKLGAERVASLRPGSAPSGSVDYGRVPLMATVRYLVSDVERAEAFYVERLGFVVEQEMLPAFARIRRDDLTPVARGPDVVRRPADARRRASPGPVAGTGS